jgi:lipopolysaccharide assembly outer membrane protein LptD (OstA)
MLNYKRGQFPVPALLFLSLIAVILFVLNTGPAFSMGDPAPEPGPVPPADIQSQRSPSSQLSSDQSTSQQSSGQSSSQQTISGLESPLTVLARSWEKTENRIFAVGNVEVRYKDLKVFADQAEVNTETKDIFASGNVVIQLPDEVVSAEKIFYNMDTRQGKIERAFGMVQPDIFYRANSIERKAEGAYEFRKADLTSCTQPTPRWKFSCSRANFKKNDYVEMWNSVFTLKKVPVFYMPYFRYPLDKERSTGFLMPQIGYSGVKGFFYGQGFYWTMARNMDATFSVDYYSNKGFGGGLEYRYLFGGGTGGEAKLYYFAFKPDPAGVKSPDAYIVRFKHNQPLPYDFRLVANVDYQTSFDFLREFDNDYKRASISNYRSEAYISRAWSYYNFSLRASRFETLFRTVDDSIITYYLPQASLNSFKIKLFSPLFFSFSSSFTSWKYGWQSEFDINRQKHYNSVGFSPVLSLPFSKIPWLTLNSSLSGNFVYYAQSYAPNTRRIIDDPILKFNYVFGAEVTGPVFYRIYQSAGGETKIKHLVEPFAQYRFDSPVSQTGRIITPYGFFRYHQLSYGLTNRVIVKREMPREVFTWGISQTYCLSPDDSPLSIYQWEGEVPRFSDVNSYARFYPAGKYSLDVSTGYNTYYKTFSFLRLAAGLNSFTDPLFLQVSWFKSMNPWYQDILGDRHQVGLTGRLNLPRLNLEVLGEFDFNVMEKKMLYTGASLVYHYQCLDFKADMRVFYYRDIPEVQYRVTIGLGNIGKTTDILGGLDF